MGASQVPPFAATLRRFRVAAGLTQEALAERAHLSVRAVSDLERGERTRPRKDTVLLLADALDLAPRDRGVLAAAATQRRLIPLSSPVRTATQAGSGSSLYALVGRVPELALIERLLAGEGPPVLVLAGEPGIGKSRLLHEAAVRVPPAEWSVVQGGCHRRSGQEPFAPLVGALARHLALRPPAQQRLDLADCTGLACLLPELVEAGVLATPSATLPPEQERRLLFTAVGQLLTNLAGPAGTLLVLDDLQWAGADALDLLGALIQSAQARPLRVLCAYRSTEVRPPDPLGLLLADLARAGLLTQIRLGALGAEEAALLLAQALAADKYQDHQVYTTAEEREEAQLAGMEHTVHVEQIVTRTGGVPYFLISCAHGLRSHALGLGGTAHEDVPWDVAWTIRQRVAALPLAAQTLLVAAAVIGRSTRRATLVAVTGLPEHELVAGLEAACEARLLEEQAHQTFQFPHDLVREAIVADLSDARRALVHRQVAEVLELQAAPSLDRQTVAAIAWHFGESGDARRALPYLAQAGDQAKAVFAHAEAEQHYRMAVALAHELGDRAREAEALEKLGTVVGFLGRRDEAIASSEHALQQYEALGDREGELRTLADLLMRQGEPVLPRALALLDAVRAASGGPIGSPGLVTLYVSLACTYHAMGRYEDMRAVAEQAVERARALGDDGLVTEALFWRGAVPPLLDVEEDPAPQLARHREEQLRGGRELIALAERAGKRFMAATLLNNLGGAYLCDYGDFASAKSCFERSQEVYEQVGPPQALAFMLTSWVEYHFFAGDWAQARACAVRLAGLTEQVDRHGVSGFSCIAPIYQGMVELAQGREPDARRRLERGLALARSTGERQGERIAQRLLAERDLVAGDAASAAARLDPLLNLQGEHAWMVDHLLPLAAWAQLELGHEEQARATLDASTTYCGRVWLADAQRIVGLLALRQTRWHDAMTALDETLALCRALPYPYAEAKALSVYGQLHAAKGEPDLAREKYVAALAICERLGEGLYRPHIERALAYFG